MGIEEMEVWEIEVRQAVFDRGTPLSYAIAALHMALVEAYQAGYSQATTDIENQNDREQHP